LATLTDFRYTPARRDLLQARLHMLKEEWSQAAQLLDRVRAMTKPLPSLLFPWKTELLLGACFEKLGNADQALAVYQEAVKKDPLSQAARLRLAETYAALDRLEKAVDEFRQLQAFEKAPPEIDLLLARLLIQHNSRLPETSRNLLEIKQLLDRAAKNLPNAVE